MYREKPKIILTIDRDYVTTREKGYQQVIDRWDREEVIIQDNTEMDTSGLKHNTGKLWLNIDGLKSYIELTAMRVLAEKNGWEWE